MHVVPPIFVRLCLAHVLGQHWERLRRKFFEGDHPAVAFTPLHNLSDVSLDLAGGL